MKEPHEKPYELYEIMPSTLIDLACEYKGVTKEEIFGKSRLREHVICRVLISFMHLCLGWQLSAIGRQIGNDHAAIIHYRNLILNESDLLIKNEIRTFRIFLENKSIRLPSVDELREVINNK